VIFKWAKASQIPTCLCPFGGFQRCSFACEMHLHPRNRPATTLIWPPLYILIIETWPTIQIHHNQRKEALLKKSVVCLLTCAFSAIMISELSSAIIIQSHSKKIQITEEDIPELFIKTLKNWFHRQIDFGSFQPINDTYFPRTFKKTVFSTQSPIQL